MKDTLVEGLPRVEGEVHFQTLVVVCLLQSGSKTTTLEKGNAGAGCGSKVTPEIGVQQKA